ncbi:response regulator transcription factor [Geobacter pickeringii]|uniref:Chemotaxis protein CheY n=1 Tax=Geobacter pickeringii TaxID=345632 RepID=A0A0B5BI08_9BACT|nr:response regulator [Geobacter pickeringii]AJE03681.1 chemotaxis protein CheY [Geobacter pickeringii]
MNKKKILIVEDEESLLKLESILLSSRGYDVTGVLDGIAALEQIDVVKPDLVILDIMLPEMDGFEVCRRIKANPATSHIPVVMLTAKKSGQDQKKGLDAGAAAYVTKPFKSARIMEIIQGLIAG